MNTPRRSRYLGLLPKILLASLLAGLLPLLVISYNALRTTQAASDKATAAANQALDSKELQALQQQTAQTAQEIAADLETTVNDTRALTLLPRTAAAYQTFYSLHTTAIHYPVGLTATQQVQTQQVPVYPEMAYIGADGWEKLRIVDGQPVASSLLRHVADPAQTTYRTETYFTETRALPPAEVYVSHLTAWHTSIALQPAGIPDPAQPLPGSYYGKYQGVFRFGTSVFDAAGQFDGIVLLTLDARVLMERVMHILPASTGTWTPWPSFTGGNYAFIFDDEGYFVAHPVLSGLRGLDAEGHLIAPWRSDMTPAEQARHPFYMQNSPARDVYPVVLAKRSGFLINPNVVGVVRANVYAPIPFAHGAYRQTGLFGGLVIGARVDDFHKAASLVRDSIESERAQLQINTLWITAFSLLLLVSVAVVLSRSISRPIARLTLAARRMEANELDSKLVDSVANRPFPDEVSKLAQVFKDLAILVQLRERRLEARIHDLNIQLDQRKKEQQVAEITETDYFRGLQQEARRLRAARARQPEIRAGDGAITAEPLVEGVKGD